MNFRRLLFLTIKSYDSPDSYDPDTLPNGTVVTYTNEVGKPKVTKGEDGKITGYEFTDSSVSSDGSTNFDTGVLALDGNPFSLTLKCTFKYSDNSSTHYPTLLNALQETSPYYGFLIRYEGSALYFIYQSNHYSMSVDSSNKLDITITYDSDKKMTVVNNSTTVASFTYDQTVDNLNFVLCSSVDSSGNAQRYAIATITEFKVTKS